MDTAQIGEVIARAQRREPAAFDTLVEAYSPRLYGYFYRLTGSRHDAEDLLQEVRKVFQEAYMTILETNKGNYYRVRVGRFETRKMAYGVAEKLASLGYSVLITSR
jgi:cell division septation protein DedD